MSRTRHITAVRSTRRRGLVERCRRRPTAAPCHHGWSVTGSRYGVDRPGPPSGQTALLPLEEGPCPSCVALLDQLDGAAEHATQRINFAVVAKTPLPRLVSWADECGWRHLRLLSSAANTYNRDYFGETADGAQVPMLNVFHRDGEIVRHFCGAELTYGPIDAGQDHRSVGTLEPLWNLFDLTREGRPDWNEQISYP